MTQSTIIAVASGKGGVGKSLLTANLAIALAKAGKSTIAMDLDLGGSNLHSYLGCPNTYPGIGDYLLARCGNLSDLILPTSIPQLGFIPGDARTPCMANLAFSEKIRLMLAIRWLKADYILIDLGAGSAFNALDFFALSKYGLLITSPEYPSVMNLLVFLRNFLYRSLDREFKKSPEIQDLLEQCRRVPTAQGQLTIGNIIQRIGDRFPEAGEKADGICKRYQPRVIYNFCLWPDQLQVCHAIDESSRDLLSIELTHFGSIFEDYLAREATFRTVPLLPNYPDSHVARCITQIADQIIQRWEAPAPGSAAALIEATHQLHQQIQPS